MNDFFIALMAGYVILSLLMFISLIKGPTVFDRLNALGVIGQNVVVLLVILGVIIGRVDMYVDIAITYSIIGFAASVIVARYLYGEKKEVRKK